MPGFARGYAVAGFVLAQGSRTKPGGADRDRTDDLLNAIQALSQLSYGPTGTVFVTNGKVCVKRLLSVLPVFDDQWSDSGDAATTLIG